MDSIEALRWRYATKKFDQEILLSGTKINKLINAFNLTATSYGLQPLKLIVIQDKNVQKELKALSHNQQQLSTASHVLIICIEKKVGRKFIENYFKYVQEIRETPDKILSPFKDSLVQNFENAPLEEIKRWAMNQAYLVMGTLLTVCAVEKIDSCPMEGFQPKEYDALLGLAKYNLQSVLVLPVGYRSKDDAFAEFKKVRRPLSETVIYFSSEDSVQSEK